MILLPAVRPAHLKGFSITVGLLGSLFISAISYWLDVAGLFRFVIFLPVGFSVLGLFRPKIVAPLYAFWNVLAGYFARGARLYLMTICFYIILFAVSRAGTSINLARPRPEESLWRSKKTLSPDSYPYEFAASVKNFNQKGWFRSYFCWARLSGHLWAFLLLPLLTLISAVEIYQDRRFPAGVYTLF